MNHFNVIVDSRIVLTICTLVIVLAYVLGTRCVLTLVYLGRVSSKPIYRSNWMLFVEYYEKLVKSVLNDSEVLQRYCCPSLS